MTTLAAAPPRVESFTHRTALDGLRAVAAILVVLFHADLPWAPNGYLGVDVFFVLSGFLITSLLVRELAAKGRLSFTAFYARRARRLLPAALSVLVITAVAYRLWAPAIDLIENRAGFVFASTYLSNWYFLAQAQDYFAEAAHPSPVLHYWSLSVEEQFYLVWPLLLLGLVIVMRARLRALSGALGVLAVVFVGISAYIWTVGEAPAYFNTIARVYQLLIGAVLASWVFGREQRRGRSDTASDTDSDTDRDDRPRASNRSRRAGSTLAFGGVAVLVLASTPLVALGPWPVGLIACLATATLIVGNELHSTSGMSRALSTRPARALGRWSYSIYLWHWPVVVIGDLQGWLPASWWLRVPIVLALSIALAAATFRLIERPTSRIGLSSLRARRTVIVTGLAASAVVALGSYALLTPSAEATQRYEAAVAGQAEGDANVTDVDVTGSGTAGATPTVMVVGDSHANFWRDAFASYADEHGMRSVFVTRVSCPWMDIPAIDPDTGGDMNCDERLWQRAIDTARTEQPGIVFLASRSVLSRKLQTPDGVIVAGDPGWEEVVADGVRRSLEQMLEVVPNIVLIEPIPETPTSMLECVVGLADGDDTSVCDQPATDKTGARAVQRIFRAAAKDLPGVVSLSLDDDICPGGTCPAVVDGVTTFRDEQHITWEFATTLMPALERQLAAAGLDLPTASAKAA